MKNGWKLPLFSALGLLWGVSILPAILHDVRHLCPVRPDGLSQAEAMPTYSRKYGMSCMQCHFSFPLLNSFGRQFKLNGYVPETENTETVLQSADGSLWMEKYFPWGAEVKSRPYDKSSSKDNEFKLAAIQSLTLWISGGDVAKRVSWFGEIDSANDSGFSPTVGELQLGYHPSPYLNLVAARRGFFVMDPYQTLTGLGNSAIADRAVSGARLDQGSLSQDTLDELKQTLMVFGQALKPGVGSLYYAAGASADKNGDAGKGRKDGNVRLAFDTLRGFMIGAFGSFGREGEGVVAGPPPGPTDRIRFSRIGADTLVEAGNLIGRAAFLYGYDKDQDTNARETNRAAYGELLYIVKRTGSEAPFLVPLVRQNWYQTSNPADASHRNFAYFTAQLAHYFTANVKAFIEYTGDTKQDITSTSNGVRAPKDSRWTAQVEVGF